jgi:hypothetical protein
VKRSILVAFWTLWQNAKRLHFCENLWPHKESNANANDSVRAQPRIVSQKKKIMPGNCALGRATVCVCAPVDLPSRMPRGVRAQASAPNHVGLPADGKTPKSLT